VLTPTESLVPIYYYSQLHVIRGINSDAWHTWAIPPARKEFSGAPLYFAVSDNDRTKLSQTLQGLSNGIHLGDTVLYEVR
jgi:hypothetical protein